MADKVEKLCPLFFLLYVAVVSTAECVDNQCFINESEPQIGLIGLIFNGLLNQKKSQ
jgi:hypothetical protein